jgi:hypothetical protein
MNLFGELKMNFYNGLKKAVAVGVMVASLTGLAGILNAQEPKFTPVKVNTLQKDLGDTLVYVSFYQTDKPNSSGVYPVQVKLYFGKRMADMMISETKESETFNSTSDRCWGMRLRNDKENDSVLMKLYDSACADQNSEQVVRTQYMCVGQGEFKKKN